MTFGDILDAVCRDGINPSRRGDAKTWVRLRHAMLWDAQPWTFKNKVAPITFTANQQAADGPADVHAVFSVYDGQGCSLPGIRDLRKFFDLYNTLTPGSGPPEAYTVVDGAVLIGPMGNGSVGQIVYQAEKPALVDDEDLTGLPDGYEFALVHGGRAEGLKVTNIPLAADADADYEAAVTAMENAWLDAVLETGSQVGAYRPGTQIAAYR